MNPYLDKEAVLNTYVRDSTRSTTSAAADAALSELVGFENGRRDAANATRHTATGAPELSCYTEPSEAYLRGVFAHLLEGRQYSVVLRLQQAQQAVEVRITDGSGQRFEAQRYGGKDTAVVTAVSPLTALQAVLAQPVDVRVAELVNLYQGGAALQRSLLVAFLKLAALQHPSGSLTQLATQVLQQIEEV